MSLTYLRQNPPPELCRAVLDGNISEVREQLSRGKTCDSHFHNRRDCLHIACLTGKLEIVQLLLDNGFPINTQSKDYRTPMHEAVSGAHADIVEVLLQRKAKTQLIDSISYTPLHTACEDGYEKIVVLLLTHGANINTVDAIGRTALHVAKTPKIIQLLLKRGLDVNTRGYFGNTALHSAAMDYDEPRILTLLDAGADPTIRNERGSTPVYLAEIQTVWRKKKRPFKILKFAYDKWVSNKSQRVPRSTQNQDERIGTESNQLNALSDKDICLVVMAIDRDDQVTRMRQLGRSNINYQTDQNENTCVPRYVKYMKEIQIRHSEKCLGNLLRMVGLTESYRAMFVRYEIEKNAPARLQLTMSDVSEEKKGKLACIMGDKYYQFGLLSDLRMEDMDGIHYMETGLKERSFQTLLKITERFPKRNGRCIVQVFALVGLDFHKAHVILQSTYTNKEALLPSKL